MEMCAGGVSQGVPGSNSCQRKGNEIGSGSGGLCQPQGSSAAREAFHSEVTLSRGLCLCALRGQLLDVPPRRRVIYCEVWLGQE